MQIWESIAAAQLLNKDRPFEDYETNDSVLEFDSAYRKVDGSVESYIQVLAKCNGDDEIPDWYLDIPVTNDGPILICPYAIMSSLNLSHEVWKHIVKLLRSYGKPVYLMADEGKRMDSAAFFEDEMCSNLSNNEKLDIIASASLLVGMPCAWTWLGAALKKKMLIITPDNIPSNRWFWQVYPDVIRMVYEHDKIQIPLLLTGIRQLIAKL